MSQILRDLNKLAEKMGAPVVGQNISEQVRAISTFYGGTTHGANINERINEVRRAYNGSGGGESEDLTMPDGFYRIGPYGHYYTTEVAGVDWRNPWEICICVRKLASSTLSNGTAFGDSANYWRTPKSLITDTRINLVAPVNLSQDSDVLDIVTEETLFPQLVAVFLKYGYDGSKIYIDYSTDGKRFVRKGELELSKDIEYTSNNRFSFGSVNEKEMFTVFPNVEFLWHKCYIKVNGETVWGNSLDN